MKRNVNSSTERRLCNEQRYSEAESDSRTGSNSSIGCALNNYSSSSISNTSLPFINGMLVPSMIQLPRNGVAGSTATVGHIFPSFGSQGSKGLLPAGTNSSCHVCRVCAKTFRASSLLDIHMRVHVGAKPFVCPVCGHRATQKGNLKLHMKKHHGADLPPHIDLVPDSGIWGHPQENVLFSESGQILEIVSHSDASGKRKQVAQAVSSLLNEEVVELIKKYQNEVGQGTAGTITESLEDFIRIAKNKSTGDAKMAAGNGMPEAGDEKYDQGRKKRLAFSLRFQPYLDENGTNIPRESTPQTSAHGMETANSNHCMSCTLCGKPYSAKRSLNKLHFPMMNGRVLDDIMKLPLCDNCVAIQGYMMLIPSFKLHQQKPKENNATSPTTINHVVSEELRDTKMLDIKPEKCEQCGTILEDHTALEGHKNHCHFSENISSIKSKKELFLSSVGLIAECSASNQMSDSMKHIIGLNPVISRLMFSASKSRSKSDSNIAKIMPKPWIQLKPVTKKAKQRKRPRSCDLELESHAKRKRASPNVLNMLRQTLLNSADQKLASRNVQALNSQDAPSTSFWADAEGRQDREVYPYRNPAMQSLAQIGKSTPVAENAQVILKRPPENYSQSTSSIYEQENSGYMCQYCPKWFKYRSVLDIHLRSHTGERPYKCPYCEYAGTQHNCLKLHIQRHHPSKYAMNHSDNAGLSGMRQNFSDSTASKGSCFSPVNCPVCGRVSPSPGYLKIHMRSHKKSLDHICHICGRGFKEYWYLSTHLKTHERELNSMKLNVKQYKHCFPLSKTPARVAPAEQQVTKTLMNRLLDTKRSLLPNLPNLHAEERNVILKSQPSTTEHILKSYSDHYQTPVGNIPVNFATGDSVLKTESASLNSAVSRSRRRKATCPSRVVSSQDAFVKSSGWRHSPSPEGFSAKEVKKSMVIELKNMKKSDSADDLPLDLRCDAKKMSDLSNSEDVPINLCKM